MPEPVDIRVLDASGAPAVPERLPVRPGRGELRYLSMSAVDDIVTCPEKARRRRILRYDWGASGPMIIGSTVDRAVEHWINELLQGRHLDVHAIVDYYYRVALPAELEDKKIGSLAEASFDDPQDNAEVALLGGRRALELYIHVLNGYLKDWEFVSAQEEFVFRVSERVAWKVTGKLDVFMRHRRFRDIYMIRDLKIRVKPMMARAAAESLQGPLYMAGKMLEGKFCYFGYDSINRMAKGKTYRGNIDGDWRDIRYELLHSVKGESFGAGLVRHEVPHDDRLLQRAVRRVEMAAVELTSNFERFGPDHHWPGVGDRNPGHWSCSAERCPFFSACPSGGLLTEGLRRAPQMSDFSAEAPVAHAS